ncbi:mitochondrial 54S ribosomal protein img2 [Coemansia sp. RSA 2711]|nr:mitochondrial 54S ribosomal protein img2 [Coemansia sp. RSA 2711]KAJ2389759.1 mitochondrial 54S ribosomal protein img2 [Coemansia sp. RSA 2611]
MFRLLTTRTPVLGRLLMRRAPSAFESTFAASEPAAALTASKSVEYPYFICRTRFQSLPVYTDYRNGRTLKQTVVRRIDGDIDALRTDIAAALNLDTVATRGVSRQLVIKGDHALEVRRWLTEKGF